MDWIKELFAADKPIIGMCHLDALPGDPRYDASLGLAKAVEHASHDIHALQKGGVDAIMFSNENSLPYLLKVEPLTIACMARIITEVKSILAVPFGVNVLWDPTASIDLAVATGAAFVREIFTGVYASDFGLWNTSCGEVIRHKQAVGGEKIRTFYNILPEASVYLANRTISDIARTTVFNTRPDALCVSGLTAGMEASLGAIHSVKEAVPDTPVFANTGVQLSNVYEQLGIADGAIVGTAFKQGGNTWCEVDEKRVQDFMAAVREFRRTQHSKGTVPAIERK